MEKEKLTIVLLLIALFILVVSIAINVYFAEEIKGGDDLRKTEESSINVGRIGLVIENPSESG